MSTWRDALTDSEHDLHQAAWLIFAQSVQVDTALAKLADQQEAVKPLLLEIIEDDYLFEADAPGDGYAPITAMDFIEAWQMTEALPTLLELLEVAETLPRVAESAKVTITSFGSAVLDDVLAWVEDNDDMSWAIVELMPSLAGPSDESAINWLKKGIEANDPELMSYVDALVEIDAKSAEGYLNELSKNSDFEKETQKLLRKKAKDAKKTAKQQLEFALQQEKRAADLAKMQADFEASQAAQADETEEEPEAEAVAVAEVETEALEEAVVEESEE